MGCGIRRRLDRRGIKLKWPEWVDLPIDFWTEEAVRKLVSGKDCEIDSPLERYLDSLFMKKCEDNGN